MVMQQCGHVGHIACQKKAIEESLAINQVSFKCIVCEKSADTILTDAEVWRIAPDCMRAISLIRQAPSKFKHCPTPDC